MSFFQLNIDTICSKYPLFKDEILQKYKPADDFIIIDGKSGFKTATIDGKYIHSNRDPVREAERIIEREIPDNSANCLVEGFGLGYFPEAILKLKNVKHLVIAEPSPERFLKALEGRDLRHIFLNPAVSLLIGEESETLRHILPGLPGNKIQIIKNRTLFELNADFYQEIDKIVNHFLSRREVNKLTLKKFGQLWVRNLFANLDILPEAMDVGMLTSVFKNYPVLLLAAGPSLDSILPYMDILYKRFLIVAVDTSAGMLINRGINPDFTVVVDPQYWNTRHLDRVDFSKTILISESSTHPNIFRKNHNRLFFCGSLFPLGIFIEKFGGNKKRLGAGGSVATTAWDFCRLLSCGDLFCGGLDLGFPDNKTHFHGSFFEEKIHTETTRVVPPEDFAYRSFISGTPYKRVNNIGTTTVTDSRLTIYIQWFEEQIKINSVENSWNISPLGIKIEGMKFKDLKHLLSYPEIRTELNKVKDSITARTSEEKEIIGRSINKGVTLLKNEIERLSKLSGNGIQIIQEYKNNNKETDLSNFLNKMDSVDNNIIQSGTKEITSFLIQPILEKIYNAETPKSIDGVINNSEELYMEIKNAADYHLKLVINFLQKQSN